MKKSTKIAENPCFKGGNYPLQKRNTQKVIKTMRKCILILSCILIQSMSYAQKLVMKVGTNPMTVLIKRPH